MYSLAGKKKVGSIFSALFFAFILLYEPYYASAKDAYTVYSIKKGDCLSKIAKKFHVNIKLIKLANATTDWYKMRPKQQILIPNIKIKPKSKPMPGSIGDGYYVVKKGDALRSIARRFGLSLKQLLTLNKNKNKFIRPGDIITIPRDLTRKIMLARKSHIFISPKYLSYSEAYRIHKGDSLLSIAKRFHAHVDIIKLLNNLRNNTIYIGHYIFVPNSNIKDVKRMEIELSMLKEKRRAIIDYAENFLGSPYVFGGDSLTHGIDCSAFVQKIYAKFGIHMPRTAEEQFHRGTPVKLSELQPGDLVFFHTLSYAYATHVGIYIGNGRFINAAGKKSGVVISKLRRRFYRKRFIGAKRILTLTKRHAHIRHRSG